MAAVQTRRGIFATLVKHHALNAIVDFVLILVAFKWLYTSDIGIYILFGVTTFIYLTGIYPYTYSQAKIDLRKNNRYDWLAPLKIGGVASLLILVPPLIHLLLNRLIPAAGEYFGVLARFWNYPFFFFIYGKNGDFFNVAALLFIITLPVITAYISYYCGVKKIDLSEKIYKVFNKK